MISKILMVMMVAASLRAQSVQEVNPYMGYLKGLRLESFSVNSSYRSKYVFSTGANLYDKPVLQTDFFVKTKCGVFLDLWSSLPADGSKVGNNFGTELYSTLGWMGKVGGYNLSFGLGFEDLHRNLTFEGTDWLIVSLEISRDYVLGTNFTLTPFARIEINFTLDGVTTGESLPKGGLKYSYRLNSYLNAAGRAMLVYDPGLVGADVAYVGNFDSALFWKVGKRVVIELPFVRSVLPLNKVEDTRKPEFVYGVSVGFTF